MLFSAHRAIMNTPLPRDIGKPSPLWMSPLDSPGSSFDGFPEFLAIDKKTRFASTVPFVERS